VADYVRLNGVRIWYDDSGEGDPLVLLHGGFSDSRDFAVNLDRLADRFRLFMPERRGRTSAPARGTSATSNTRSRGALTWTG
jgi:pimeloyl-ACP methyl ester carboxylesterase